MNTKDRRKKETFGPKGNSYGYENYWNPYYIDPKTGNQLKRNRRRKK